MSSLATLLSHFADSAAHYMLAAKLVSDYRGLFFAQSHQKVLIVYADDTPSRGCGHWMVLREVHIVAEPVADT